VKIGIFGGSFNPPHLSHVTVCTSTLALTDVDEVWVVPCFRHAFGKPLASFEHRLRMCELAFGDLRRLRVSDVERQMGGTSFTVQTLERLMRDNPGARLGLIVGADAVRDRESWYQFERVVELAELIVFGRVGVPLEGASLPSPPECSSTDIRGRIVRGEPISQLVPRAVVEYIDDNGLYSAG
jgi:nicotinate-nucleotide adenylyltransferase